MLSYAGVALLAGSVSLALWSAGLLTSLQNAFVIFPKDPEHSLAVPNFWLAAGLIFIVAFAVTIDAGRFGGRRVFIYLGAGFLGLAAMSLIVSWSLGVDLLFAPIVISASIAAIGMQVKRLRERDQTLSEKLHPHRKNLNCFTENSAEHRLVSGLKLLDTVLAPSEAIVFRRDGDGQLVFSTRLRGAPSGSLDSGRNSAWRDGVQLCERAISKGEIIVEKIESEDSATNIALPLRHEDRTVGALLVRINHEFDDDYRALLTAVSGQMARNLQREEAHRQQQTKCAGVFLCTRSRSRNWNHFTFSTAP